MYFVGLLIGSLIGGYPADKFGRKPVLFFFIFIGGFSTLTGGLVSNFVLYTLFRTMAGIGEQVPNIRPTQYNQFGFGILKTVGPKK